MYVIRLKKLSKDILELYIISGIKRIVSKENMRVQKDFALNIMRHF